MAASDKTMDCEAKTLAIMIGIYCRDHHGRRKSLCPDCAALLDYARERLIHCPQAPNKPTCAACPIHCYKPDMRERVRQVMRYAGPRMIYHHPLAALKHLIQGRLTRQRKTEPTQASHQPPKDKP